ncbi:MAG: HIT domain-containing protein [Bacteroidota bacterium]
MKRISPGQQIFESSYWYVEHAYPTSLEGWLVIVLKRHCERLHELSLEEQLDLARVQYHVLQAIHQLFRSEREYVMCFAEAPGFKHIHFHVVPKHEEFEEAYKGGKVFHYLKAPTEEWVAPSRIQEICTHLHGRMIQTFS